MRDHLSNYWPGYLVAVLLIAFAAIAANASIEEQRRVNYCFDRGMVLVDTGAGKRCAPLYSLEKVR